MIINDLIVKCARAFKLVRESPLDGRENARKTANTLSEAIANICLREHPELKVKIGLGVGSFPEVPWVGILHSGLGHNATVGYYLVLLFSRDSERVYLTYGVGAGAGAAASLSRKDYKDAELRAKKLRNHSHELTQFGFVLDNDINLASEKPRPRAYKCATAVYIEYEIKKLPQGTDVAAAISGAISLYVKHVNSGLILGNGLPLDLIDEEHHSMPPVTSFIRSLESSNLAVSLITKSFVIITGNSGTGKTRAAEKLAIALSSESVSNFALAAVGADWTDNRSVLGYINHLREIPHKGKRKPTYQSTAILDLLLEATQPSNQDIPFFLILDEMNLSHVERYFSDFLSAMETSCGELRLHSEGQSDDVDFRLPRNEIDNIGVPRTLRYPANLFVIGTVNVDETTYMFSPKVLDRANVIEFRVTPDDANAFLKTGAGGVCEIESPPDGAAEAFLALARKARNKPKPDLVFFNAAPEEKRAFIASSLSEIFGVMHIHRMEFGYRTMHEVLRYAGVDYELAADRAQWSWTACLDVQILQKILPKLHGSKKRIEQLLVDLAVFCETGAKPADGRGVFKEKSAGGVKFPKSYAKLADMIEIVRRDQFVSFI